MDLSMPEIEVLGNLAQGVSGIRELSGELGKSKNQIYLTLRKLEAKEIVKERKRGVHLNKAIHITLFLQILSEYPSLAPLLSDSGIPIMTIILKPSRIEEICKSTGLKRAIVYRKIAEAKKRSMVIKSGPLFQINEKIWPKLKEFLTALLKYEQTVDRRVPASAVIYYKNEKEILFSCKEYVSASKTALSAYREYGIQILTTTNYYYLPNKTLTKKEIFKHSLLVLEKEFSIQNAIFVALFYAKYTRELETRNKVLSNIKAVLSGKQVQGYPSLEEVKSRAEIYEVGI